LREQIALVTAGANQCDYCASAHTLMGKGAGVEAKEATANLQGQSSNAKTQAALTFAKTIIDQKGRVTANQLQAVRTAGFGEAEIVEIIAHVSMNIFTNYFNHIAETVIDFPVVSTEHTKAA
ncbi:MAG TPA: carboxymuconolactone decarboxylase family protein, partial [Burkholderiaceae bacterium]